MSAVTRIETARRFLRADLTSAASVLESAAELATQTGTTPKRERALTDAITAAREAIRPALALTEKLTKETTR